MKKITFILFAMLLTWSSCKKEDPDDPITVDPKSNTCRLTAMDAYVYGDSLNLTCTYDASDRLIEVREDLEGWFSGTRYQYNADGQLSKIQKYDGVAEEVYEELIFSYSNGQLTEMRSFDIDNGNSTYSYHYQLISDQGRIKEALFFQAVDGTPEQTEFVEYAYDAEGNIASKTTFDVSQGNKEPDFRELFQYDDMKTVPTFALIITDDQLFVAKHNITWTQYDEYNPAESKWDPIEVTTYDYQYNAEGYPSEVVIDLGTNARFSYSCP